MQRHTQVRIGDRPAHAAVLVVVRKLGHEPLDHPEPARTVFGAGEVVLDVEAREREGIHVARHRRCGLFVE